MTEVSVTGEVIWKKFEPVSYTDKKTGEQKNTKKGSVVVKHTREWFNQKGEAQQAQDEVAFDFFGKSAEQAETVKIGDKVSVKGNVGSRYWKKGDKYFTSVKVFEFRSENETADVPF